jgi:hypothetical protein
MPEPLKFWLFFALSLLSSIGGLLYAIYVSGDCMDGQRGGAIGTAAALTLMFIGRDYGAKVYDARVRGLAAVASKIERLEQADAKNSSPEKTEPTLSDVRANQESLATAIHIDTAGQKLQNQFLAVATCIGTIVWGFGDLIARHFMRLPCK